MKKKQQNESSHNIDLWEDVEFKDIWEDDDWNDIEILDEWELFDWGDITGNASMEQARNKTPQARNKQGKKGIS